MRFMFMYARYFAKKPTWDMSNVEDDVGMYYGSPIVYVDPNSQVGVDVELEKLAAKECIDRELNSALNQDGIASFAKNVVEKATKLTETLDTKPKVEEKKVEDENIVRLRSLVDKGLLKASEFELFLTFKITKHSQAMIRQSVAVQAKIACKPKCMAKNPSMPGPTKTPA